MRTKAADKNRIIVTSYVINTDNLLIVNQMNAVALISKK